jgi:multidrug efflux pump subunit AcrB
MVVAGFRPGGHAGASGALDRVPRRNPSSPRIDALPLEDVATLSRAREKPATLVSSQDRPGVLLAVTKKSRVNTLELLERVNAYLDSQNPALQSNGLRLSLLDDQTVPTRQSIEIMQNNALTGLALVFLATWLFLGSRLAGLVSIGIPFSLAGTFWLLSAMDYTVNMTVLLGVIIALGMLVDDAVVILEDIYYRMTRGVAAVEAATAAIASVGLPVLASVLTTVAAFLPLILLPGIVGKFMMVVPLVVTLALLISLFEAFWMLPAHVAVLKPDFARPSRLHGWRTRFTHGLRVKYARLLLFSLRHAWASLLLLLAAFALALYALAGGWIKQNFFAADPIRIFYVSLDMPPGTAIDVTLARAQVLERAVVARLQPGELRAAASYSGLKFTDTEPFYGDAYGQVAVSLLPREHAFGKPEGRTSDQIVAAMRGEIEQLQLGGRISFIVLSGGPPAEKPIKVRLRGDDYAQLRAATDALKRSSPRFPAAATWSTTTCPAAANMCCASMPTRCAPPASTRRWSRVWCGCTRKAKSSPWRATRAKDRGAGARSGTQFRRHPRRAGRCGGAAGRRHHHAGQSGQTPRRAPPRASSSATTCAAPSPSRPIWTKPAPTPWPPTIR